MKSFTDYLNEELLLESPNLYQVDTKLPCIIYVGSDPRTKHNKPRVKIQNNYSTKVTNDFVPFSIPESDSEFPVQLTDAKIKITKKDLDTILYWVKDHRKVLLDLWWERLSNKDARDIIRAMSNND